MTFDEFVKKCKTYPFIRSNLFPLLTDNPALLRRQVTEWLQKKWLFELRRGIYVIADPSRRCQTSSLFLSTQRITPAYVSLETALSYYRLIPEK